MKSRKPRTKIKAKPLCSRLRRVVRAASDQAVQEGQNPELAKHAAAIRTLGKRVSTDIVEIGRRLTESKKLVVHGNAAAADGGWAGWLQTEFQWSEATATNFMNVFKLAEDYKSINFTDLTFADLVIAPSALYVLARPSTPPEVRDQIMDRAVAGEAITNSVVQEARANHVAAVVKEALAPPPATDATTTTKPAETAETAETETTTTTPTARVEARVEADTPPPADDAVSTPPPADDEQQRPAGAGNGQFTEDDPEAVWVRGLYYRAHRGIGDAQRNGDWSKYPIDNGTVEMVRQAAEAWQELYTYLKQRDGH